MTAALILIALAQPVSAFFCFRYLQERDVSDRIERATLMQRIQAPEQAVVEHSQHVTTGPMQAAPLPDTEVWDEAERAMMDLQADLEARI